MYELFLNAIRQRNYEKSKSFICLSMWLFDGGSVGCGVMIFISWMPFLLSIDYITFPHEFLLIKNCFVLFMLNKMKSHKGDGTFWGKS